MAKKIYSTSEPSRALPTELNENFSLGSSDTFTATANEFIPIHSLVVKRRSEVETDIGLTSNNFPTTGVSSTGLGNGRISSFRFVSPLNNENDKFILTINNLDYEITRGDYTYVERNRRSFEYTISKERRNQLPSGNLNSFKWEDHDNAMVDCKQQHQLIYTY